jgi:demethylmenaquinone methyltransferase/2-methoxy-6-polyprenyl-1,4-benzoquinol methylase
MQVDRIWRWRTARRLRPLLGEGALVLDLACGTGDLLTALEGAGKARVVGADFCHPMLVRTASKSRAPLVEADGLRLPVADGTFDVVTIGFGFRNFANYEEGLRELRRVLKPGGTLAILEFTQPPSALVRGFMGVWCKFVMDPLGRWISGQGDAYEYLPASVARFPNAEKLAGMMRSAGFVDVRFERFDAGIVALHLGVAG